MRRVENKHFVFNRRLQFHCFAKESNRLVGVTQIYLQQLILRGPSSLISSPYNAVEKDIEFSEKVLEKLVPDSGLHYTFIIDIRHGRACIDTYSQDNSNYKGEDIYSK